MSQAARYETWDEARRLLQQPRRSRGAAFCLAASLLRPCPLSEATGEDMPIPNLIDTDLQCTLFTAQPSSRERLPNAKSRRSDDLAQRREVASALPAAGLRGRR